MEKVNYQEGTCIKESLKKVCPTDKEFMNGFQVQYKRVNGEKVRETDKENIVIWKTEKKWQKKDYG